MEIGLGAEADSPWPDSTGSTAGLGFAYVSVCLPSICRVAVAEILVEWPDDTALTV